MDSHRTHARNRPAPDDLLRLLDFPAVDPATWKRRVEEELGPTSFAEALVASLAEGIEIEPLYSAASTPATAEAYLGRPNGCEPRIVEEYRIPNPDAARAAIDAGLHHGVEMPWLPVRAAADAPLRDDVPEAIVVADGDELRSLLQGIPNEVDPVVEVVGDVDFLGTALHDRGGNVLRDPCGEAFQSGEVGEPLERALAGLVDLTLRARGRTILVSTSPHHEAGASAVDELALALATGVDSLRRLTAAGLDPGKAATQIVLAFSVADDLFVEIAKLRAVRRLWRKVLHAAGITGEVATWIHARGSLRGLSATDPRTNLLRGTVQCFAALVGGADSIAVTPYDRSSEAPGALGRRLAVMTQHVLRNEAALDRFADPAGGSWFVETLTDRLARAGWKRFQELESHGGVVPCLCDGRIQELVRRSAQRREATAERRR
jgi:methylmalonyl-CoA mutase